MVEPDNPDLSITAQCRLLSISRSGYYYAQVPENSGTLALMGKRRRNAALTRAI